jgi:hypothetical protein
MLGDWKLLGMTAGQEAAKFPSYRHLTVYEIMGWLSVNNLKASKEAIGRLIDTSGWSDPADWLATWVFLRDGDLKAAKNRLSKFLNRTVDDQELNEKFILQLWDTAPTFGSRADLAHYFPILPASLTGLQKDVVRMPYGPSVISKAMSIEAPIEVTMERDSEVKSSPKEEMTMKPSFKVFISYAHKDEEYKNDLITMLAGLESRGIIDIWQDREIEEGDEWLQEIEKAMNECDLALLFVSANFINSRFIQGNEVPRLLQRRKQEGLRVVPVILDHCLWESEPVLSDLQAMPRDAKPIITFPRENGERTRAWKEIAQAIEKRAKKMADN